MKGIVYIQNLKCEGCENTIINQLSKIKNISELSINEKYSSVNFKYEKPEDYEAVKKELYKLGYPPYGENNNLFEKAKSYVSCAIGKANKNKNI